MSKAIGITELHKLYGKPKTTIQKKIFDAKIIPCDYLIGKFNRFYAAYNRDVVIELLNKAFGMEVE